MKVRALISFCGVISMYKDEEREYVKDDILSSLLKDGLIEEVKDKEVKAKSKKEI